MTPKGSYWRVHRAGACALVTGVVEEALVDADLGGLWELGCAVDVDEELA